MSVPFSVTIGADTFEVYGGITACTSYLNGRNSAGAVAFRALPSADDRARALIQATAFLDAQTWQGMPTTPAVGGTALQWPRTGVIDVNGNAVDSSTVPTNVVNAVFELAALFADDADLAENVDAGTNVRGVKAGSAGVDFFVPTSALDGSAPLLPPQAERLVAQYLGSAVESGGGVVSGTEGVSAFDVDGDGDDDDNIWGRSWPL